MPLLATAALITLACGSWEIHAIASDPASHAAASVAALLDGNGGNDWAGYGRTYGEQHYSPLRQIDRASVSRLGLAWSLDLPVGNPMSGPIAVDGVLYTSTGYSVVRAIDAQTGALRWTYDPEAPEASGQKLRAGWGSRGLAYWNGKIYIGTHDGRLIALDAATGKPVWTAMTIGKDDGRFITGAPRVFAGKVIIGHGGADASDVRAYVTTYDAETGKQLWRFYVVPGDPALGFEDETQKMAARTWSGEWWKYGGGGTVWNSFSYDPETDTVFLGTGNGAPWNHDIRSAGKGDNLFLCSVVALDAKTGKYKWHYQFNPGESWDYNASMDMQLADLVIDNKPRKVLMELPKNGFFYVIDRITGELISADKVAHVTWADHIDLKTGRPVENPRARLADGKPFDLFPGPNGAHTWLPSSFSPKSGLVYLPVADMGVRYDSTGIKPAGWKRKPGNVHDAGYDLSFQINNADGRLASSALVAWNPAIRREVWREETAGGWNGGVLATGGDLVFQGQTNGKFTAYDASSGKILWTFDARAPVLAPPISYSVNGRQYVTVIAGIGTSAGLIPARLAMPVDYRTQERRILTFALGGDRRLPEAPPVSIVASEDPSFKLDPGAAERGAKTFNTYCIACHGIAMEAAGTAPDLRASPVPSSADAFDAVVRGGALVANGMPRFEELDDAQIADLRQHVRTGTNALRLSQKRR